MGWWGGRRWREINIEGLAVEGESRRCLFTAKLLSGWTSTVVEVTGSAYELLNLPEYTLSDSIFTNSLTTLEHKQIQIYIQLRV